MKNLCCCCTPYTGFLPLSSQVKIAFSLYLLGYKQCNGSLARRDGNINLIKCGNVYTLTLDRYINFLPFLHFFPCASLSSLLFFSFSVLIFGSFFVTYEFHTCMRRGKILEGGWDFTIVTFISRAGGEVKRLVGLSCWVSIKRA